MHLSFQRANRMPHDHPYLPTERALHVWVPGKNMLYVRIHWSEMYLDATAAKKAQDEVCFEWQWMRNARISAVWEAHVCTADDKPRVSVSKRVRDLWRNVIFQALNHDVECRCDINCDRLRLPAGRVCSVDLRHFPSRPRNVVSLPSVSSLRLTITRQPSLSKSEFTPGVRWCAFCQCTSVQKGRKLAFKCPLKKSRGYMWL